MKPLYVGDIELQIITIEGKLGTHAGAAAHHVVHILNEAFIGAIELRIITIEGKLGAHAGTAAYLESGLGVVPVCPHDEGLLGEELGDVDGVLLRALVLVVVVHRPREEDLRVVVDVAPHVERALLQSKGKFHRLRPL